MQRILVCDIGGKGARFRRVEIHPDGAIKLLGKTRLLKKPKDVDAVLSALRHKSRGCGQIVIATAGQIKNRSYVVQSPNAHYLDGQDLGELVKEATGISCVVGNDMEVAALGMYFIAGKPEGFQWAITWSSGIGVRLIKDGEIYLDGSEIGHWCMDTSHTAPVCGCGSRGCAEVMLGGDAVAENLRRTAQWKQDPMWHGHNPWEFLLSSYGDKLPWAVEYCEHGLARTMGIFLGNMLMTNPATNGFIFKGTVARNFFASDKLWNAVLDAMTRPGWMEHFQDIPFVFDDVNEPDIDTFYGGALYATKYGFTD